MMCTHNPPIGAIYEDTPIGTVLVFDIPTETDGDDVLRGELSVVKIEEEAGQLFVWFETNDGDPIPASGEGYPVAYWNDEFGRSPTGRREPVIGKGDGGEGDEIAKLNDVDPE